MDIQSVKDEVRQYVALKDQIDLISTRQSEIKKRLIEAVDELGEFDDRGHKVLALGDDSINVATIAKQRRVSKTLDMDVAEDILTKRGIKDTCVKMVPTLDESAIMAAFYSGHLTEADIDAMFPEKVSYAFIVK
jgi:hypothetical protein